MTYFAVLPSNFIEHLQLFGLIAAYSVVGVVIMLICTLLSNYVFKLDLRKELVEDHNTAFGIMLGGLFVAIAIIVAASIIS